MNNDAQEDKPRTLTPNDRRCVDELNDWVQQVDDLLELVRGSSNLRGSDAAEARVLLATFKKDLHAEVRRLAGLRRRDELQGFEQTDYAPAIEQTAANLSIKTSSVPGPAWFRELYDARITLHYPLVSRP